METPLSDTANASPKNIQPVVPIEDQQPVPGQSEGHTVENVGSAQLASFDHNVNAIEMITVQPTFCITQQQSTCTEDMYYAPGDEQNHVEMSTPMTPMTAISTMSEGKSFSTMHHATAGDDV